MKDINRQKQQKKDRRKARVRSKIFGTASRPRLSVFRSLKHINVQIIDDENGVTLASVADKDIKAGKKNKTEVSFEVGKVVAQKAKEKNIEEIVFDRGGNKYHGRVKAVAEGAREGGLVF